MIADTVVATFHSTIVLGVFVACGWLLTHRFLRLNAAASVAGGIALAGLVGQATFVVTWLAPQASTPFGIATAIGAAVLVIVQRGWRYAPAAAPIVVATIGVACFDLGVLLLRSSADDGFNEAAGRFSVDPMPVDNRIPSLLASYLAEGRQEQFLVGDWLPSDRPGLQSGIILVARAVSPALGLIPGDLPSTIEVDFGASVAAQLLWVPAVFCLLAALGHATRVRAMAVAATAIVPVMFINSVFTWPKVLAGAFTVASIALLVMGYRRRVPVVPALSLAGVLASLGLLSHGATAFVLPFIVAAAIVLLIRADVRSRILSVVIAAVSTGLTYLPGLLFQRIAHPPGDRLLKWHLAGVIPIDDRTFSEALADQYGALSWQDALHARLVNLSQAFDLAIFRDLDVWNPDWQNRRIQTEFYETPAALGVGSLVFAALLISALALRMRRRVSPLEARSALLCLGMLTCVALWALVLYSPTSAIVHQGSHTWVIVLLAVSFAWLANRSRVAVGVVAAAQAALALLVYQNSLVRPEATIRPEMVILTVVGVLALALAIVCDRPIRSRQGWSRPTDTESRQTEPSETSMASRRASANSSVVTQSEESLDGG